MYFFSEQIKTWALAFLTIDLRFNLNVEKDRNPGKWKESLIILYMSLFICLYTWDNFLNKLYNADEHTSFLVRKQWFSFSRNVLGWKFCHLHKVNNLMIEIKWINNPVNSINKIRRYMVWKSWKDLLLNTTIHCMRLAFLSIQNIEDRKRMFGWF